MSDAVMLGKALDRLRGEASADPTLVDDKDRLRTLVERIAAECAGDDTERRAAIERELSAQVSQLREAGS